MSCYYDLSRSPFAGMTQAQLQQALATAQQAYQDLMTGGKIVSVSYTQGDGAKSVTYTQANMAGLLAYIQSLQAALGLVCCARRPLRPWFW